MTRCGRRSSRRRRPPACWASDVEPLVSGSRARPARRSAEAVFLVAVFAAAGAAVAGFPNPAAASVLHSAAAVRQDAGRQPDDARQREREEAERPRWEVDAVSELLERIRLELEEREGADRPSPGDVDNPEAGGSEGADTPAIGRERPADGAGEPMPQGVAGEPALPQGVVAYDPDDFDAGPSEPPSSADRVPRYRLQLGPLVECLSGSAASFGRFPAAGVLLPEPGVRHRLSANPLPAGGEEAWFDAAPSGTSCFEPGVHAAFSRFFDDRFFLAFSMSYRTARHVVEIGGEAPDLIHWGRRRPFSFSARIPLDETVYMAALGVSVPWGASFEVYGRAGLGVTHVRSALVADLEAEFYGPAALDVVRGPAFPVGGVAPVVTSAFHVLPAVEAAGGFLRWIRGPVGAGLEFRYLLAGGAGPGGPGVGGYGTVNPDGGRPVPWTYAPRRWSVAAAAHIRF